MEHSQKCGLCLLDSHPGTFLPLRWSVPANDCCLFYEPEHTGIMAAGEDDYIENFFAR